MATAAASIEDLPAELIQQVLGYLLEHREFGSVAALGQCSRRLAHRVLPVLYHNVGRVNKLVGQDALIWAADNDEIEALRLLLKNGVDPCTRFYCAVPDSVRQDLLAVQRPRRPLSPAVDGRLVASLTREAISESRRLAHRARIDGRELLPLTAGPLYRACMSQLIFARKAAADTVRRARCHHQRRHSRIPPSP